MTDFAPELDQRRAQITQARDTLRRQGYGYTLELEILRAQHPEAKPEDTITSVSNGRVTEVRFGRQVDFYRARAREAYAGAQRMQELLDELPEDGTDDEDEEG